MESEKINIHDLIKAETKTQTLRTNIDSKGETQGWVELGYWD